MHPHLSRGAYRRNTEDNNKRRYHYHVKSRVSNTVYYENKDTYDWLKEIKPVFRAGYSIFLYDLTNNKDGINRLVDFFDKGTKGNKAKCLLKRYNNNKQ